MDELDGLIGAQSTPIELNDIVGTELPKMELPKAALRNRAATVALASDDPANAVNDFQLMMAEGEAGTDTTLKVIQDRILQKAEQSDRETFMSVLSDPNVDMNRKLAVVKDMANNPIRKDVATKLFTDNLQKPSPGETVEAEDARVGAGVRAIEKIYKDRETIQNLVNAHAASLQNDNTLRTGYEMASAWVAPFSNNILMATLTGATEGATPWQALKALLLPGSAKADVYKKLRELPAEQRAQATQEFIDLISKNSQTLFANNNQFAQYQMAVEAFTEGGYTNVDKWLDNLSTVLDVVGLGFAARAPKGVSTLAKGLDRVEEIKPAVAASRGLPEAKAGIQEADLAQITGKPTVGIFDAKIAEMESQKAALLGEAGNTLDKGQVRSLQQERKQLESDFKANSDVNSLAAAIQKQEGITSKAAKEKAQQLIEDRRLDFQGRVGAIDSQLEANKNASTINQRIADLEKRIEDLKSKNTEVYLKKDPLADAIERIERNSSIRMVNPASPYEVLKAANPQRGRDLFTAMVKAEDTSVSEALTGVSRTQAIANDVYPQAVTSSGKVAAQPVDIQRNLRKEMQVPDRVYDAAWADLGAMYTAKEKAAIKYKVAKDFESAQGLTMRENMGGVSVADEGLRLNISAVYGTPEGDFKNARQAFEQAKHALRSYGVLDEEIEVLSKQGLDYVPVKLSEVGEAEGSYVVRVNTKHEIDPTQVVDWEGTTVRFNFFDSMSITQWGDQGSLSRYLMDASSMLDPKYTGAASIANDRAAGFEKVLLEVATEYSDAYKALSKAEQKAIDAYHREANFNELKFDAGDLRARGFSDEAIEAVAKWRKFWDGHFYLENLDLVRTMNSQGYMLFSGKNADLYAKRIEKNGNIRKVYDPGIDKVVELTKVEMDELYEKGGFYAKLRRPSQFDDEIVEHMIVRNTPQEYLRKFRDSDRVLAYKEGYYQIHYNAPRFVDEIVRNADGNEIRRAIAVAGDTAEADRFAERMRVNNPDKKYEVRGDERALNRGSDEWFDIASNSGRIAQRHRGQLLEGAAGINHLGDQGYVVDPVTSAIRAAKSIAGRTVNRPMLEAAKARFMQQHAAVIQNSDGMGGKMFPRSLAEIGKKGGATTKQVADARSDFNYINYLENGYVNSIDSAWKQFFNSIAGRVGKKGLGKGERALMVASELNPAQLTKQGVFMATIAANPLRQLIVQPHQVARMLAYNPIGMANGTVIRYTWGFANNKLFDINIPKVTKPGTADDFYKFAEESGMLAAIDKQNLVRGTLVEAADSSYKAARMAAAPVNVMRKVGFDTGEAMNTLGHLAAVYDKYMRDGKDLTNPAVRAEAYSMTRALSYDMNFAGDMPYNQTAASLLLQFMQVPHKAAFQIFNRRIPLKDRAALAAGDVIFWGPPTLLVSSMLGGDILPDDPDLRELVVYGAEGYLINQAMQELFNDESINVDFSSLAPYDMQGISKALYTLFTQGPWQAIVNSPSGQMFLKDGGRIPNAFASALRFFGIAEPIGETPDTFLQVMNQVMNISSGWSNATKAYIALETGKRQDQYGRPVSDSVHSAEAVLQAFGFGQASQRDLWRLIEKSRETSKSYKDDVLKDYRNILRYYQTELEAGIQSPEQITRVTSFVLKRYENQPEAMKIIREQMKLDLADPNSKLLYNIMKSSGLPEGSKLKDAIRMADIPQEQKDQVLQRIDDFANMRQTNKE